ncbi:biotin/lipoyl-containing protein, partial [Bordetella pertussis]|uniref:biotin/lipoyl-containing protein n=1 Tax=Bordetella pertussis TaxID=520 RepID=UPI000B042B17
MSNIVEIKVPDIGDFKEVEVIEVLVSAGDTIKAEQSLITVESDKASMEIPASAAGVVKSVKVKVGDKIAEGTVILEVEAAGEAAAAPKAEAPKAEAPKAEQAAETPKADAAKAEAPQAQAAQAEAPAAQGRRQGRDGHGHRRGAGPGRRRGAGRSRA